MAPDLGDGLGWGEERRDSAGREDGEGWMAEKGAEGKKGESRRSQY